MLATTVTHEFVGQGQAQLVPSEGLHRVGGWASMSPWGVSGPTVVAAGRDVHDSDQAITGPRIPVSQSTSQ